MDYDRQLALVVDHTDKASGRHRILGVGRLIKLRGKSEAEVAILVSDHCLNQGLGIELLRRAIRIAHNEKLRRVSAEMLPDNLKVQSIFKKVGFRLHMPGNFSSVTAVLDL